MCLPGRRKCNCQARIHDLVSNCLGCGKVVCTQEGSGPCFYCSNLVVTREQQETLDRNSRKSAELYKQLTGKEWPEGGLKNLTLASIADSMKTAIEFRNNLLEADADSERRTRVNDLECDFANVEKDPYLSAEERNAVIKRRDELRAIREKRKRAMVVNIDMQLKQATEKVVDPREYNENYDPIIRQILDRSEERRKAYQVMKEQQSAAEASAHWKPIGFVPKYGGSTVESQRTAIAEEFDAVCLGRQSNEAAALEVERRGLALALAQPVATLVANGCIRKLRWAEDPMIVGPVFVCSTSSPADPAAVESAIKQYKLSPSVAHLDFSGGSVLGRCFLETVLSVSEYEDESGSSADSLPGTGQYVLEFSASEPLVSSVPHIPPVTGEIYTLDPTLRMALSQVFAA